MKSALLFVAALSLLAVCAAGTRYQVLQLSSTPRVLRVVSEAEYPIVGFRDPRVIVVGEFNETILEIGWHTLKIETSPKYSDEDQAYAAGFFEGKVTAKHIENHFTNFFSPPERFENVSRIYPFFDESIKHMEHNVKQYNKTDPFWFHVGLMWIQWNGMHDGLNSVAPTPWPKEKLFLLTSGGDLFDLLSYFNITEQKDIRNMTTKEFELYAATHSHCSALFKVTEDLQEIFFGHIAWFHYNAAYLIFKHYTFNYNHPSTAAKTISLSGYPGILSSFDDYYMMDTGMVTIETTVNVYNKTMYDGHISADNLMYWIRIMVANRMATNGADWVEIIQRQNSGTYNNQWMALDLKLFNPGHDLQPNTLWIAEQYPGIVKTKDVTDILRYGYYPSYNVPSDRELWWASGYGEATKLHGPNMTDYDLCVRARIFRRDQAKVKDMESYIRMLQYNDYENDPISNNNPVYAIAMRGDLLPAEYAMCDGGFNSKASSYSLYKKGMTTLAFGGMTPQQPQFTYQDSIMKDRAGCYPHIGLPTTFNFSWVPMKP